MATPTRRRTAKKAATTKVADARPAATVQTTMEMVASRAQESYRAAQDSNANIGDRALRNLGD